MYNAKKIIALLCVWLNLSFRGFCSLFFKSFYSGSNIYSQIFFVCENIFLNLQSNSAIIGCARCTTSNKFVFYSLALSLQSDCAIIGCARCTTSNKFVFYSLALSLQSKPCEYWLKRYENCKNCVFYCTCGVDYGVVPRSRILQLWMSKSAC